MELDVERATRFIDEAWPEGACTGTGKRVTASVAMVVHDHYR